MFNKKLYEQKDEISMVSPLGYALTNIMMELQNKSI